MAKPEDTMPSLQAVANFHGKYSLCPHLSCNRPGQCVIFRRDGAAACFHCGWDAGLDVGSDIGYKDGYIDGKCDGLDLARECGGFEEDERTGGMD